MNIMSLIILLLVKEDLYICMWYLKPHTLMNRDACRDSHSVSLYDSYVLTYECPQHIFEHKYDSKRN